MAETATETVDGTVVGIVFRNDETGYSVLRVSGPDDGRFRLKKPEIVVVGTCGAVWEGEELHAIGECPRCRIRAFCLRCGVIFSPP